VRRATLSAGAKVAIERAVKQLAYRAEALRSAMERNQIALRQQSDELSETANQINELSLLLDS
jgi:hypothetical protein